MRTDIEGALARHAAVLEAVRSLLPVQIEQAARLLVDCIAGGCKVLICGNGGSAADAQHMAAELTGRYVLRERRPLPALALTTDTSALTAIANDLGFESVFARQVEALGRPGDVLIAISTSGNSLNVLAGIESARTVGCRTIGLTGQDGGKMAGLVDLMLAVPCLETARVQEMHILIGHIFCEMLDARFASP